MSSLKSVSGQTCGPGHPEKQYFESLMCTRRRIPQPRWGERYCCPILLMGTLSLRETWVICPVSHSNQTDSREESLRSFPAWPLLLTLSHISSPALGKLQTALKEEDNQGCQKETKDCLPDHKSCRTSWWRQKLASTT